jgi:hypothetical protein
LRQAREFAQFVSDSLDDLGWLNEQIDEGTNPVLAMHTGVYVAAIGKKIVGASDDAIELRREMATIHGVPESRIAIANRKEGSL